MRLADGQVRWVHGLGELVFDQEGHPVRMFGTIQDITERKRAEEQIKSALAEKEVLLKEVHHRVKNNLQVVYSLLHLQANHLQDPQARRAFRESQDRVRSMALIHEKLYQSPDLAKIDFGDYVRKLVAHLFHSYQANLGSVAVEVDVCDTSLGIDAVIPCGLLINELVSNSLKHAFPPGVQLEGAAGQAGWICITFDTTDGTSVLVVSDNGIGFPPEIDFRHTDSLGLQLVMALVQQLGGVIELERRPGTTFRITFAETR
jgi:two-component sensor histidine kinase